MSINIGNKAPLPSVELATLSSQDVATRLRTSLEHGLDNAQDVNYRKSINGSNELVGEEEDPLIKRFLGQFYENPLILLLIGSAAVSCIMKNTDDAISITLAIIIVVTVGFVQEYRSEKSLQALSRLVPPSAHLTRGSGTQTVLASSLVPGDLVHFSVGDRVPADVRIVSASALEIDESNLTGETHPVLKSVEAISPADAQSITTRKCIGYMGTLVCGGSGSGIVVGTGLNTEFGAVFGMMAQVEKPKTPLQKSMDKLGQELSYASFGVIGIICLIGVIQGRSWLDMFTISVSLAVAAIPEGLPIIVTVTLALGVLRMASEKAIMRTLPSVETLGSVNVVCTDKTGTLTQNKMSVSGIWTLDMGPTPDAPTANEFQQPTFNQDQRRNGHSWMRLENDFNVHTDYKLTPSTRALLQVGNLCNNARHTTESSKYVGNPTDIALIEVLSRFGISDARSTVSRQHEIPFSSSRKWQSVTVHSGDKSNQTINAKGAWERIIPYCATVLSEDGKTKIPITAEHKSHVEGVAGSLAAKGLRVLAFARGNIDGSNSSGSHVSDLPKSLTFIGLVGLADPPRPGVQNSIRRLMQGGVRIIMITGDMASTAISIAKEVGIPLYSTEKKHVMEGDAVDKLSVDELAAALDYVTIFARVSPEHKLSIVRALQSRGDVVAMTGDGVNDAPALKLADIGISMGESGTDVAREASDMILVDDDFSTVLSAIREGKAIFYNIQSFIVFQLSTSVAALSLVALSTIFRLSNPLNAMQILWINILMDGPPAQSLGVEPVDPEIMMRPPRSRKDHVLTMSIVRRVLRNSAFIIAGTMFVYVREMRDNIVTRRDTTMTFTCFVLFDMFNALACRSSTKSVLEIGLFSNKMFNFAVGGSLLGQLAVIYLPFLQRIFQTEALGFSDIAFLIALTSSVFWAEEFRKYLSRTDAFTNYSTAV